MTLTREQILAMPAGPEMDALVAERVLGMVPCGKWREWPDLGPTYGIAKECEHEHGGCYPDSPYLRGRASEGDGSWRYSGNIADAWEVATKLGLTIGPTTSSSHGLYVAGDLQGYPYEGWCYENSAEGETAPLAICRAALLSTL